MPSEPPAIKAHPTAAPRAPLDYAALVLDQLAGPVTADGQRHGWPQLGDRSLTDAVAYINDSLASEPPPLPHLAVEMGGEGSLGASVQVVDSPSSRLRERGQRQEQDSPPT